MFDCTVTAVNVYLPKDRVTNMHQQYGFVEYKGEEDADYVSLCSYCLAKIACILRLHAVFESAVCKP